MDCSPLTDTELHQTALRTMESGFMLEHGDRVAVGVSGGADSVALLTFLCSIRGELGLQLVVCHLNHSLRGAESAGDAEFVRRLCQRLGVEYRLCTFDAAAEAAQRGLGVEEYARERRYAFFAQCAGEQGRVATAHTLSDSVETVLFHLVRGTGLRGLCGIPRVRDRIVRPLRDCTREQVETYLTVAEQDYRNDSTNSSDIYSRNYIRHNLIPAMTRLNPAFHTSMARMMDQMAQQWQMTRTLADRAAEQLAADAYTLDRLGFLELPQPVAAVLLQDWLEIATAERSGRLIDLMTQYAHAGTGGVELSPGYRFVAEPELLRLVCETAVRPSFYRELRLPNRHGEYTDFPLEDEKFLRVSLFVKKNPENTEKFYNKDLKNFVDCDKIEAPVFIHEPRKQDTIRLQDRNHSLQARYRTGTKGLSAGEISRMTVAEDAGGTLWAERLGADQTRADSDSTQSVYYFEVVALPKLQSLSVND